jgi:Mg2+ and Co2+ transporter CorA
MGTKHKLLLIGAAACLVSAIACAQDSQDSVSLGDLARQQRQQKEQAKTGQGKDAKDAKAPKVITNEEIPEHSAPSSSRPVRGSNAPMPAPAGIDNQTAEMVKSRILDQKNEISSLQKQIDDTNDSIRFAPANCVSGCADWNQHQRDKQDQVQRMQETLEQQKKRLEEMQDAARAQGFGSSVYDP